MDLTYGDIADHDFLLLPSPLPASVRYDVSAEYVIVRNGHGDLFLLTQAELEALSDGKFDEPLDELLAGRTPDSAADESDLVDGSIRGRTVILDRGNVAGFYHVARRPFALRKRRTAVEAAPASRWLCADSPAAVLVGETVPLVIWLDQVEQEEQDEIRIYPDDLLAIVVQAQANVSVGEPAQATLTAAQAGQPLRFTLRGEAVGAAAVSVLCFRGGDLLATVKLRCRVLRERPRGAGRAKAAKPLVASAAGHPDLTLIVNEQRADGRPTLTYLVTAHDPALRLTYRSFGPVGLQLDPQEYFTQFFHETEALLLDSGDAQARQQFSRRCLGLYEQLLPLDLRNSIWSLGERIRSVQIFSEEPWIPWEVLQLNGLSGGRIVDGPFLCERYVVTRWKPGERRLRLRLGSLAVIADATLPAVQRERLYLHSLKNGQRKVEDVRSEYGTLVRKLAKSRHDVWHYCGHAQFVASDPDRSFLVLDKGRTFAAADLTGEVRNFGRNGPLVFFNACRSGRTGISLTGIGGWSAKVIDAGAAAFVGPLWAVSDDGAYRFAQRLYEGLLAGEDLGTASFAAREHLRRIGDPAWLAYAVFADPFAAVATGRTDLQDAPADEEE